MAVAAVVEVVTVAAEAAAAAAARWPVVAAAMVMGAVMEVRVAYVPCRASPGTANLGCHGKGLQEDICK